MNGFELSTDSPAKLSINCECSLLTSNKFKLAKVQRRARKTLSTSLENVRFREFEMKSKVESKMIVHLTIVCFVIGVVQGSYNYNTDLMPNRGYRLHWKFIDNKESIQFKVSDSVVSSAKASCVKTVFLVLKLTDPSL